MKHALNYTGKALLLYLLFSFVIWDFSPNKWLTEVRFLFAIFLTGFEGLYWLFMHEIEIKTKNKQL